MSTAIWIQTSYHDAFKCGGWAYVRSHDKAASGQAGGERYTSPERMALAALLAALKDLPKGAVSIQIDNAAVARTAALIAAGRPPEGDKAPTENLDLWAALTAALAGRQPAFAIAAASKASPTGFAAAWAELARDKANAQGAFVSAIPRPNLAKVAGLPL
ncbi:MAG: ribonuclease H [Phenylobacterium sp.]|uniref:ribonuclease H n=1 Tax=Phenylobacterium sp. TaxID=1871053 RepID=UPI0025DE4214|nr:ribonuclease H [Phenylobacterium sp.]MBA4013658.1 ribonuclease H [Phenylobacterium sp.]